MCPQHCGFKKLLITEVRRNIVLHLAVLRVTNETYYGCEISRAVTSVNLATDLWLSPTLPSKLLLTQETVTFPNPGKLKHLS